MSDSCTASRLVIKKKSNYEVTEGKVNNGQAVAVEVKYSHTERGINKCYIFN